jgi:hypothetical protein
MSVPTHFIFNCVASCLRAPCMCSRSTPSTSVCFNASRLARGCRDETWPTLPSGTRLTVTRHHEEYKSKFKEGEKPTNFMTLNINFGVMLLLLLLLLLLCFCCCASLALSLFYFQLLFLYISLSLHLIFLSILFLSILFEFFKFPRPLSHPFHRCCSSLRLRSSQRSPSSAQLDVRGGERLFSFKCHLRFLREDEDQDDDLDRSVDGGRWRLQALRKSR